MINTIRRKFIKGLSLIEFLIRDRDFPAALFEVSRFNLYKKAEVDEPPTTLTFHIMKCNLRCPTCQYKLQNEDSFFLKEEQFISPEEFLNIFTSYPSIKHVVITGGESLLHPDFDKLVKLCLEQGKSLTIPTNGVLINKRIDALRHCQKVSVSLDSYDYASFKVNRGGSEEQYNSILDGLLALRKNKINFFISFLLSEENFSDIPKMLDFSFKYLPNYLIFQTVNPHSTSNYSPILRNNQQLLNLLKLLIKRSDYPFSIKLPEVFDTNSPIFKKAVCPQLWGKLDVNEKGDVSYCCHLYHDPEIGNIFTGYNFNSPKMLAMRQMHLEGRFPGGCIFCRRRFDDWHIVFDVKTKKWNFKGHRF